MRATREDDRHLRDRVVVITGVSGGFGRGAAIAFAKAGAAVVVAARRSEVLEEVARECESAGARTLALETDVSDPVEVSNLCMETVALFGRIDVWINNAGAGAIGRFDQIPLEDHIQAVETTLLGTLYGSYVALRQFRRQRHGTLINMGSIAGKVAAPYYASYVAAKHGIVGLSAALRRELEQEKEETRHIHVCTVLPAAHDTPFFQPAASYSGHHVEPPPPVHDPTEVVEAIVSLALDPTRDEAIVGAAGKASAGTARLSRSAAERMISRADEKGLQTRPARPRRPEA